MHFFLHQIDLSQFFVGSNQHSTKQGELFAGHLTSFWVYKKCEDIHTGKWQISWIWRKLEKSSDKQNECCGLRLQSLHQTLHVHKINWNTQPKNLQPSTEIEGHGNIWYPLTLQKRYDVCTCISLKVESGSSTLRQVCNSSEFQWTLR